MLLQNPGRIKVRSDKIARRLKKELKDIKISVSADSSRAGGGSLPEVALPTYVVAVKSDEISVNELEERLRKGTPPIIARIKEDSLILDARTIRDKDLEGLVKGIRTAFQG